MVNTWGQWFEEENYSKYPKEKWCVYDYMANWIRAINYTPETEIKHLIYMCVAHYESWVEDEETSFCDETKRIEDMTIEEIFEDIKEYVEASGGLRDFDYYC